jgi:hypothetical protein
MVNASLSQHAELTAHLAAVEYAMHPALEIVQTSAQHVTLSARM